jgi:urease gamma subunit
MTLYVKVVVKGEPDTFPFTRIFAYSDRTDERIFFNAVEIIKEKLDRCLKINANEALVVYVAYVVDQLRAKKSISLIKENASKIMSADQVMIGVPETLAEITFEVVLDHLAKAKFSIEGLIVVSSIINNHHNHSNNVLLTQQERAGINSTSSAVVNAAATNTCGSGPSSHSASSSYSPSSSSSFPFPAEVYHRPNLCK